MHDRWNADDFRAAICNRHLNVLRFLKDEVGLTADDFRAQDNDAIRWAAENGHVNVLKFLKDEVKLTADESA